MDQNKLEVRYFAEPIEVRARKDDSGNETITVAGYAIVFNSLSVDLGQFKEQIAEAAFTESIRTKPVFAYYAHNKSEVLGRTENNTLRLNPDSKGVAFELDLPATTRGKDLAISIKRGDITGVSFGFNVIKDDWSVGEFPVRTVQSGILHEISIVADPAYEMASVALRSLDAWKQSQVEAKPEGRTIANLAAEALKKIKLLEIS